MRDEVVHMEAAGRLFRSQGSKRLQAAIVAVTLGVCGIGIVKEGRVDGSAAALNAPRRALAISASFRIKTVVINGRKQLTQDEVLAIIGVDDRSSLLFLDAKTIRDRLMANPWIADATVLKIYPSELRIDILERSAFALWQHDGRLSVIADDGTVVEPYVSRRFASLPLVVGNGAEAHAKDFLTPLSRYPQVKSAIRAAIFVGQRRWKLDFVDDNDLP